MSVAPPPLPVPRPKPTETPVTTTTTTKPSPTEPVVVLAPSLLTGGSGGTADGATEPVVGGDGAVDGEDWKDGVKRPPKDTRIQTEVHTRVCVIFHWLCGCAVVQPIQFTIL